MTEVTEQLLAAVRAAIKNHGHQGYDNSYYQPGLSARREGEIWEVALYSEPMKMIVVSSDDVRNCPPEELARMIAECWDSEWDD